MPKMDLAITPPCAQHGHPLASRHPNALPNRVGTGWWGFAGSLQKVLTELLAGEAYRHGLSPHLQRDVGLSAERSEK